MEEMVVMHRRSLPKSCRRRPQNRKNQQQTQWDWRFHRTERKLIVRHSLVKNAQFSQLGCYFLGIWRWILG